MYNTYTSTVRYVYLVLSVSTLRIYYFPVPSRSPPRPVPTSLPTLSITTDHSRQQVSQLRLLSFHPFVSPLTTLFCPYACCPTFHPSKEAMQCHCFPPRLTVPHVCLQ